VLLSALDIWTDQILEQKEIVLAVGVLACFLAFGDLLVKEDKPTDVLETWEDLSQRTIAAKRDRWEDGTPIFSDAELETVFKDLDEDGSGQIDLDELERALKTYGQSSHGATMKMLREADADGDLQVSFDEFKRIMRGGQATVL